MSDRLAAHISIGGRLARAKVPKLLDAIASSDVSLEWGDRCFRATSGEGLLNACKQGELILCDDQASWGEFPELEAACRKLGLSYDRFSEGKYEHDPEIVVWRPGMKEPLIHRGSNSGESIYVPADEVKKALKHLEAGRAIKAKKILQKLCPEVPELPTFEIV